MIALLPGFMSVEHSTPQQLAAFLGVMLPSEFLSSTPSCHGRDRCLAIIHHGAGPRQLEQVRGGLDGAGCRLDAFRDLRLTGATDQMPGAQLA